MREVNLMSDNKVETKKPKKINLKCALCGKKLDEKGALVHKNQQGQREIICYDLRKRPALIIIPSLIAANRQNNYYLQPYFA